MPAWRVGYFKCPDFHNPEIITKTIINNFQYKIVQIPIGAKKISAYKMY